MNAIPPTQLMIAMTAISTAMKTTNTFADGRPVALPSPSGRGDLSLGENDDSKTRIEGEGQTTPNHTWSLDQIARVFKTPNRLRWVNCRHVGDGRYIITRADGAILNPPADKPVTRRLAWLWLRTIAEIIISPFKRSLP
jgi:hypothetical protein